MLFRSAMEEREAFADWASQLGFAPLHRMWQLLLKGHDEVAGAIAPVETCEMALLRIIHAAQMPDPSELARLVAGGAVMPGQAPAASPSVEPAAPASRLPASYAAMVEMLWSTHAGLADRLEHDVRPVRYAAPEFGLQFVGPTDSELLSQLGSALKSATGVAWQIMVESGDAGPSISEQKAKAAADAQAAILNQPIMKAAMAAFPDAELMPDDGTLEWSASK